MFLTLIWNFFNIGTNVPNKLIKVSTIVYLDQVLFTTACRNEQMACMSIELPWWRLKIVTVMYNNKAFFVLLYIYFRNHLDLEYVINFSKCNVN